MTLKEDRWRTIMSFEMSDRTRLACSIEVRRREERYHPIKGLFRQYELIYVWATEKDVIGVRTRCRRDRSHTYSRQYPRPKRAKDARVISNENK